MSKKVHIDRDWLIDQYITNKRTATDISKELGCSNVTILNAIRRFELGVRDYSEAKTVHLNTDVLNDRDWLYDQYISKDRTAKDIGISLGLSDGGPVISKLKKFNIAIKSNRLTQLKTKSSIEFLDNREWLIDAYITKNRSTVSIANELGCTHKTVLKYLCTHNIDVSYSYKISTPETEISKFLDDNDIKHKTSDRTLIRPYEIDILIKDKGLAIEVDGVYWHSLDENKDIPVNRRYHLNKTMLCEEKDVNLIHVTCQEWETKQNIIKSMLLHRLGISTTKIFARNTELCVVAASEEKEFLITNHLQGYIQSNICYGLKYNNEYVCMISFGAPRYNRAYDFEILRIASKLNTNVVGGVSKLFKHFMSSNNGKSIITYADRRYSNGNIYKTLGFTFSHNSDIGFKWIKNGIEYNRMQFQKHKLQDKLKKYDPDKSSTQNMFDNGYRKLYDCGQAVFVMPDINFLYRA